MYNEIGCSAKVWKKRLESIPIVIIYKKKVYKYTQKFLKVIIKKKVKHTYHTCKTIILQSSVSAVFSAVVAFG